jgi:hypothetical protein
MEQRWCLGNKKTNKVEKNLYPNQVAQRVFDHLREGLAEKDWVVWLPGWPSWKPLVDVPELIHEIGLLKKFTEDAPPPMPMMPPPPPMEVLQASEDKQNANKKAWENRKPETVNLIESPEVQPEPQPQQAEAKLHVIPEPTSSPIATHQPATVATPKNKAKSDSFAHKRKHERIFVRYRCIIRSTTLTFRTFTKDISLGGVALEDEIPQDLIGSECMIYITSPKANKNLKFKIALTSRSVAKYFSFQDVEPTLLEELEDWLEAHQQLSAA